MRLDPERFDPERFTAEVWQQCPLFLRGAFEAFEAPLSPEELAGLACEPEVESRLVLERGGDRPWEVRYGPFTPEAFAALPAEGWSLLVHGVDRLVDGVAALLEPFRFLPNWCLDDVMVSYAPPGSSVGAHLDAYDVFLLQGTGTRRWSIEGKPRPLRDRATVPDVDVDLLRSFEPDRSWRCAPGDLLYLPAGHAHHGVAVDACTTYSIGFRAPSRADAVGGWLAELAARSVPEERLTARAGSIVEDPGRLDEELVRRIAGWCREACAADADRWAGSLLTRPRAAEIELYDLEALDSTDSTEATEQSSPASRSDPKAALRRSAPAHFAYRERRDGVDLYVGGRCLPRSSDELDLVRLICGTEPLVPAALSPWLERESCARLIERLIDAGFLSPME